MRIIIFIPFFLLFGATGYSQQLHFAFLQTDTHTPFYVTLNKKNYSSTASGYIILPKLQNGDYSLRIGFAKNEGAEQEYLLQVKDNDQGFLVKDFGDKGWGLFNLQTMAVQYAGTAAQERAKLAAAEKAEAEQRQRKLDEDLQAAALQRRNDSLKTVAEAEQRQHKSDEELAAAAVQRRNDSLKTVAIAEQRQHKSDEELGAAALLRRDDSMKAAVIAQQSHTDSVAAVAVSNRQRMYEDSIANKNNLIKQQQFVDSVATVKAVAKENERLEKIADSVARAQAAAMEKKTEKVTDIVKAENANEITEPPANPLPPKKELVKNIPAPVLIQQRFTDSGWHYAYHITNNNQRETVNVFIPASQPKPPVITITDKIEITPPKTAAPDSVTFININIGQDTTAVSRTDTVMSTPADKSIDQPIIAAIATTLPTETNDSIPLAEEKPLWNPKCKEVASEKDFLTARKKIAAAFGTDAMLVAAQKVLKQKCYTTEQLRNLCFLFLTDVGRYQFLDMAYPVASDAYRYNTLQDLLIDAYFIQRFKAMIR